jgi:hypothetical protein
MVSPDYTTLTAFPKKLIGTTDKITDDTMKTHIFTTQSGSYEITIQIFEQQIPSPTALLCMDAICEYAEGLTVPNVLADLSTRAALYSHCGICGGGRDG